MKYELINPSDKIWFDADNDKIAFVCCLIVSNQYSYRNTETDQTGNFYLFGIDNSEIERQLGENPTDFIRENEDKINKCFKSFRYDSERTSMNKIVDYAHECNVHVKEVENE